MAYEPKHGDISLFRNEKRTNDNQPTIRGTLHWNGEKIEISLWPKTTTDGRSFLSGKAKINDYVATPPAASDAVTDEFIAPAEAALPEPDPINIEPTQEDLPF